MVLGIFKQMKYILFICLFFSVALSAQVDPVKKDSTEMKYIIIEGDSIPKMSIDLDEVYLLPDLGFKNRDARIRYIVLRRKTFKVYPYAKLAADRLVALQERFNTLESKGDKRRYAKDYSKIY